MISKNLEKLINVFVWDMQGSIDALTDNYCYDELIQSSFNFQNPSVAFLTNSIDLIQS